MSRHETIPKMPLVEIEPGLELIPHDNNQAELQAFSVLDNQAIVGAIKLVLQKEKIAQLVNHADSGYLPKAIPAFRDYAFGQANCERIRTIVPDQDTQAKEALKGLGFRLAEVHLARQFRVFDLYSDPNKVDFPPVPVDPDRMRRMYLTR